MKTSFYLLTIIILSQCVSIACIAQTVEHLAEDKTGQTAPDFNTVDLDGDTVSLRDLRGKVVILNFWHLRCGSCWLEVPDFNKIKQEYEGQVVVLSVTFDDQDALWQKFGRTDNGYKMNRKFNGNDEFNYTILPSGKDIIDTYGVKAYPVTFYIDQMGQIRDILPFFMSYEGSGMKTNYQWMKEAIDKML